jgi:hypothetical protein
MLGLKEYIIRVLWDETFLSLNRRAEKFINTHLCSKYRLTNVVCPEDATC